MKMRLGPKLHRSIAKCGLLLGVFATQTLFSGQWTTPQLISHPGIPTTNDNSPTLIVTPKGNAIAVWTDAIALNNPDSASISSAFYTFGVGWSPAVFISDLSLNIFGRPLYNAQADCSVAMNSSNYAVAAWEGSFNQPPDFPLAIVYAVRSSDGTWSPAANLVTDAVNNVDNVNVAMNEAGTTLATWEFVDETNDFILRMVSFLPFGGSWSTPFAISLHEDGTHADAKPFPGINSSGNAVVCWQGRIFPNDVVGVATYKAATNTWSPPLYLDSSSLGVGPYPRCAIDDKGNAVAVWATNLGAGNIVIKTAFFDGSAWQLPIVVSPGIPNVSNTSPDVVIDSNGLATALFVGNIGTVYSTSRQPDGSWSVPQVISTGSNSFFPDTTQIALAAAKGGDLGAIWTDFSGVTLFADFSLVDPQWGTQEFITTVPTGFIGNQNIGLTSCGFAIACWDAILDGPDFFNVGAVYASIRGNLLQPGNTRIKQCSDKFATQKSCVNILRWSASPCAIAFKIYRDGELIGTVKGGKTKFIDPVCCKSDHDYTITFVNAAGFESDPIPFN